MKDKLLEEYYAKRPFVYWCNNTEELLEVRDKFKSWIETRGGVDVYYSQDLSEADTYACVPRGETPGHWRFGKEPSTRITELKEFSFRVSEKIVKGLTFNFKGEVVDYEPDSGDEATWIDLHRLTGDEAYRLDQALGNYFERVGAYQGERASVGDGGHAIIPWARGLNEGDAAWALDNLVVGVKDMNGCYTDALWEGYEQNLPAHLSIVGSDGDGSEWWIDEYHEQDCPHCGGTVMKGDLEGGHCRECGEPLVWDDDDEEEETVTEGTTNGNSDAAGDRGPGHDLGRD
jgi:hypothetical protein